MNYVKNVDWKVEEIARVVGRYRDPIAGRASLLSVGGSRGTKARDAGIVTAGLALAVVGTRSHLGRRYIERRRENDGLAHI